MQALNVCKEALSSLPSPEEYADIIQWDTSDIFMENLRFSIDRIVDVVNCRAFRGLQNYVDETPDIKLYAKYIPEIKDFADETWREGYDGLIESGESFWYFYNETAGNGVCGFVIVDRLSIIEEYDNIIVEEIDEDAKLSWNKEEPREAAYHVIESDNDEMIEWAADAIGNELVFFLNGYYEGCEGMYILFNSKTLGKFVEWSKSASIEPVHQPLVDDAERCRSGDRVRSEKASRNRPVGHVGRERDQQEHTADKSRVEDILSETAEGHLCDSDGDDSADEQNPPRCRGGKVESQQDAGHGR